MSTELVFKLEKNPEGFDYTFASDCKIEIRNTEGNLYLNYENRIERIVGSFKNMRTEGECILAEVKLFENLEPIKHRLEFAIDGAILSQNSNGEVDHIVANRPAVIMHNKF
jgi:hypothetical protein